MIKGKSFLFVRERELSGKGELSVCVFGVRCAISVIVLCFCPTAESMLSFSVLNKYSRKIHFLFFFICNDKKQVNVCAYGGTLGTEITVNYIYLVPDRVILPNLQGL